VKRRGFLRSLAAAAGAVVTPRWAAAEDVITVGVILPSEPDLAAELRRGTALGLEDANALATLFGKRLRLETETASETGALQAGRTLVRGGALALVGGVGLGASEALDALASEGAVMLNVGASDDRLRGERCDRRVFHLIPSISMYVDALALILVERRQLMRWAVAADGSPRGLEIEAAARRSIARRGGSLITDGSGGDALLLAMQDASVRAAVGRAAGEGRAADRIAGVGDAGLRLLADQPAGLWSVAWHHDLERFSARELNSRFRRRQNASMVGVSWAAWAALKLIGEAVVRGGAAHGPALVNFLESAPPFDGHKGDALTFRKWDHQLRQPLYVIGPRKREASGGPSDPFTVIADTGTGNLDALGTPMAESRCRFSP
jgi:ABC-type branched-subunit amino acid transport system substrate-binding protein